MHQDPNPTPPKLVTPAPQSAGAPSSASNTSRSRSTSSQSPHPITPQTKPPSPTSLPFEGLFATSRAKLWLIAAAVTNDRTEADDVLQEAAIVGLAKFASFTPAADIEESFERWMGQITRNLALNARRKRTRSDASMIDNFRRALAANATSPLIADKDTAETNASIERLLPALEDLEEAERTCLLLRVVGCLTYKAISTVTGLPEGTAMSHVFRARQHLRRRVLGVDNTGNSDASHAARHTNRTSGELETDA